MSKKDIRSLSIDQIKDFFVENGLKEYRGDQLYSWLWEKSALNFDEMTNLSKKFRDSIKEKFYLKKGQKGLVKYLKKFYLKHMKSLVSLKKRDHLEINIILI